MLNEKTIAVVVPAYNEEKQIHQVLKSIPEFVDRIVVVDDCSIDKTSSVVVNYMNEVTDRDLVDIKIADTAVEKTDYNYADQIAEKIRLDEESLYVPSKIVENGTSRIIFISHQVNSGVGSAISSGYKWCRDHRIDCTAVMAGDGQMDPAELESICEPIASGKVSYVKGNRLIHKAATVVIPKTRFLGNSILSILTKIASGYWHVSDTQTGFTAISLEALEGIQLHKIYRGYGVPNDILVKLNIGFFRIMEIPIKPIYNVGEQSKMKIWKVIPKIFFLLISSFFERLFMKYFLRNFHPLFICYLMFFITFIFDILLFSKLLFDLIVIHRVNDNYLITAVFTSMLTVQFLLFGMWFDMQDNERLYIE
jgi:glycosyltransferase involved in cell wall biosynthesis